jgi:hypothetical protein
MPTVIGEAEILRQVLDYLALHRYFHYRQNSGGMVKPYKGKSHFVRFGFPGAPDVVVVHRGRYIGVEVKAQNNDQSQAQRNFQSGLEAAGGKYLLVHSIEELMEGLR